MNTNHTQSMDDTMPDIAHHTTEVAAGIASKTSIGTGIGAVIIGGVGLQDWLLDTGMFTSFATFFVNWYYQHKRSEQPVRCDHKDHG